MFDYIKRILIGRPLKSAKLHDEKFSVFWGLPILASDAISSVAYASEEILIVLVPMIGVLAYTQLTYISLAIIGLLVLLMFSYLQTIENYPNGGGAYVVAKENIGKIPGITAGAALSVDYILTVAVSICAGTAAITSAFPVLHTHKIAISLVMLLLLLLGNLRGLRESARIFSLPTYAFILGVLVMLVVGFYKYFNHMVLPGPVVVAHSLDIGQFAMIFLMLKAFSSGCSALTGVEAVSNAVPNFKKPAIKHAQHTLMLLAFLVFLLFGGITLLANIFHVVPSESKTVLSQIAEAILGKGFLFYYIQTATALILIMAANTAFSGFPMLVSVIAQDSFLPRQLMMRGDRLNYSNGIIALSIFAAILIVIFKGDIHSLIPLYAVGVFLSFTLSQTGMFLKWKRERSKNWRFKALLNGSGAFVTFLVVITISIVKFIHGAWVVIVLIPILVKMMLAIRAHYDVVVSRLFLTEKEKENISLKTSYKQNIVVVPLETLNRSSLRALRYARTISTRVIAFNVSISEDKGSALKEKWATLDTDIELVVKYSPYRKLTLPLLKFIKFLDIQCDNDTIITVILPKFSVSKWWQVFLHNQTKIFMQNALMQHSNIVVATIPLHIRD